MIHYSKPLQSIQITKKMRVWTKLGVKAKQQHLMYLLHTQIQAADVVQYKILY